MIEIEQIRKDLQDIRYYYAKQKEFEQVAKIIGDSRITDKVNKYNDAIREAPIRLYDIYAALYINNNTQEALAYDWDCSNATIGRLHKKLDEFLRQTLT